MTGKPEVPNSDQFYHSFQNDWSNFDDFVRRREYRDENLALVVRGLPYISQDFILVDGGCGNGLVAQLVIPVVNATLRRATLFGIDPDPHAIAKAQEDTPSSERCKVHFIQGLAQNMDELLDGKVPAEGVDVVTLFNSIHEIPEQDQFPVIKASAKQLRPDGIFVANSSFTTVAQEDNPMEWNRRIHTAATKDLGGKLNRDKAGLLIRPPEGYEEMYESAGLVLVYKEIVPVMLQAETLAAITKYSGYREGVFLKYDFDPMPTPKQQQEALERRLGSGPLLRKWVRWIYQKPA